MGGAGTTPQPSLLRGASVHIYRLLRRIWATCQLYHRTHATSTVNCLTGNTALLGLFIDNRWLVESVDIPRHLDVIFARLIGPASVQPFIFFDPKLLHAGAVHVIIRLPRLVFRDHARTSQRHAFLLRE